MGTALNYLKDVDIFEAFLDLDKDSVSKNSKKLADKKVNSLYTYIAMKEILFELIQELKNKHK